VNPDAFIAWLKSIKLTPPVTIDDMRSLKAMIKGMLGEASVEIRALSDTKVIVMAKKAGVTISRTIDVV
jgi:hypothetical protein